MHADSLLSIKFCLVCANKKDENFYKLNNLYTLYNIMHENSYFTSSFNLSVFVPSAACSHGDIRLRGDGHYVSFGRVEVCVNGVWGTVCDKDWTNTEASIVCTQLGYSPYGWLIRGINWRNIIFSISISPSFFFTCGSSVLFRFPSPSSFFRCNR